MELSSLVVQLLNGLAQASSLFIFDAGLSLIFGVTRVVNFAHGSFFMFGLYIAYTLLPEFCLVAPRQVYVHRRISLDTTFVHARRNLGLV